MADQVTISTFLELRDNLSEGMKKAAAAIEAATGRVRKARSDEERAAAQAAKTQERAAKEAIRNQLQQHKEIERMANRRERENAREDARQVKRAQLVAKEEAAAEERKRRFWDAHDNLAKKYEAKKQAADAKALAAEQRKQEKIRKIRDSLIRANEVAAERAAARQMRLDQRIADNHQKELRRRAAADRRYYAQQERDAARDTERKARQIIAAHRREARERERLETQITTAMWKAKERRIAIAQREAADRKRITDRYGGAGKKEADLKGGGLFGTMVGANLTADALRMASMYGMRAIRGFYTSAIDHGKNYEKQISAIAGSIFTQGLTSTYSRAKEKTVGLIDTIRKLAAKLPGEASDYVKVFTLTLPSALARGITDTQKYAEMVSKYTAIAVQRGYKGQAGYQLNEILQGRVRVTTNMFQVLAPYMGLTSREFNKITDNAERMKIVFNAIEKSAGALPAVAKDAESIFGTLKSQLEMLSVTGQFPLFESMKIAAVKLSEIISGPGLGTFVRDISTALGDLTVGAVVFFKFMFDQASRFANWVGEKLRGIPGFEATSSAFRALKEAIALADPIQTMMKIGAEERKKWRAQEEIDIRREGRVRPREFGEAPAAPSDRANSVVNFNNNRFEIKQEFAEGFDPDRIAFAFASDLTRLGEMKLQAAYSLTGGSVR